MNRENLQRMADYIKTIPERRFNMQFYGSNFNTTPECNSVGCVVGHCSVFASEKDVKKFTHKDTQGFDFVKWSEKFSGLKAGGKKWSWCFSGSWSLSDNTAKGASKRIEWLLKHGLPENSEGQERGHEPLCYNQPIPKNRIVHIGYTGGMRCYLNMSDEEALKRYCESEGVTEVYVKINEQIESFEFEDEFSAYQVYPNED